MSMCVREYIQSVVCMRAMFICGVFCAGCVCMCVCVIRMCGIHVTGVCVCVVARMVCDVSVGEICTYGVGGMHK